MKRVFAICAIVLIIISFLGFILNGGFVPRIDLDDVLTSLDTIGNKWDDFYTDLASSWGNAHLLDSLSDFADDITVGIYEDAFNIGKDWVESDNIFEYGWTLLKGYFTVTFNSWVDFIRGIYEVVCAILILLFLIVKTVVLFSTFVLGSIFEFIGLFNNLIGFTTTA